MINALENTWQPRPLPVAYTLASDHHIVASPMAVIALLIPSLALAGQSTVSVTVKPTSTVNFTSFRIVTDNGPVVVTPPAGWAATRDRGSTRSWTVTGGVVPPGGTLSVTVSVASRTPTGTFVSGDYLDANGNTRWIGTCNDPVSFTVVEAGATDYMFLGYTIPAGEYGYFYEMWNAGTFGDQTKSADIRLGMWSGAHDFMVLATSYPISELEKLIVPSSLPPGTTYELTDYMDPQNATGSAGAPTAWSFNPATGTATMTFYPGDSGRGLGAGEMGSVVAFSSPFAPTFTETPNTMATYVGEFECPTDYALVPVGVPEPGTLLMLCGGMPLLAGKAFLTGTRERR